MALPLWLSALVFATALSLAPGAAAQSRPTVGPTAPPLQSPRAQVAPLSHAQVQASVRQAVDRLDATVTGAPISVSVRQPYHAATEASLGFGNAYQVLPQANEALLPAGQAGGLAIVTLPNTFTGETMIDCEIANAISIRWYGGAEQVGEVGTTNNHAVFVVPASAGNTIYIQSLSVGSWTLQACRMQRVH